MGYHNRNLLGAAGVPTPVFMSGKTQRGSESKPNRQVPGQGQKAASRYQGTCCRITAIMYSNELSVINDLSPSRNIPYLFSRSLSKLFETVDQGYGTR
jgi:hypothetical protein